jgi:hypothetical protein
MFITRFLNRIEKKTENIFDYYTGWISHDGCSMFTLLSMSTRQIGHRLLVGNHWSTHSLWNKCMHGKRRTSSCSSYSHRHIVHLSTWSSSLSFSSSPHLTTLWNLCGRVFDSIISRVAPLLAFKFIKVSWTNS